MPHDERSLLVDAIVYLTAAVVFVPLASRFRLGSVLGYLAAGCVIGPFGLGLVRDVEAILHFAEIGVVLMLFVIGLELEPARLSRMRRVVFGGGTLQMATCGAVLVGGALVAGLPWRGALIAGLALALSSTAIAVQTMRERGVLAAPLGQAAFGVLLFQDVAAIPIIGLVPLLAVGPAVADAPSRWLAAARVVLAVVGVVGVGRALARPILRAIARTDLREVFTAFALLLVLGIAKVMELAGVSMALGAFLAGVLLASSEYRHALETDIEPFKGLLMGLFFIAVGMSIDFGLLAAEPLRVAALVVAFVALKALVLAGLAGALGVGRVERWLFAALLAQGGEFAFVVFGVARGARLLPGEWDDVLTLVVALSMALTPLAVLAAEAIGRRRAAGPARASDRIEAEEAPVLIAGFGRFGQIVGRLLFASGLKATVLDHNPDQVDLLRRFGFRVFYGDATRLDLLRAAGAARARVVVNAIDDVDASLRLVDLVHQHFPGVVVVARARNVAHLYELERRGVAIVERELFEASLVAGRRVLEVLGVRPFEARERADRFRRHNTALLAAFQRDDVGEDERRTRVREARDELERQFRRDVADLDRLEGADWQGRGDDGAA